jgi:hypothetical protein
MEDMLLTWLDFICPYILFVMLLTVGLTVCAIFVAAMAAVYTAATGFRAAFTGRKKCGPHEHNRCCGASKGRK